MIKEKHKITIEEWEECKNYFNYRCAYCGEPFEDYFEKREQDFHKEHYVNIGSNKLDNCVPACVSCNFSKNNNDFEEWYKTKEFFTNARYWKIKTWINHEYKKHIHATNIEEIITYNTDKGHLLHIKNDNITLTKYLKQRLKINGRKSVWVAEKLGIPYKTYISKIDSNTITVKELLIICDILELSLNELHIIFPDS